MTSQANSTRSKLHPLTLWRAIWLYGPRWWPLGLLMAGATVAFAWWLFGLLTEPVGPEGPEWLPSLPMWLQELARWEHADKLAHAGLFGGMSVLALIALFHLGVGSRLRCGILTVLLVGVCFGTGTELVQAHVPTRHFDVWDIVADAIGSALAVTIWLGLGFLVAGLWRRPSASKGSRSRKARSVATLRPIGLRSRFVPHPDVEVQPDPRAANSGERPGAGGLLLVHLATGVAFRLNATGERIWPGIQAGESVAELCERLASRYPETERERLRHDTESLLRSLWVHELVKPQRDAG